MARLRNRLVMSSENINWWIQYYYDHPDERMEILRKEKTDA